LRLGAGSRNHRIGRGIDPDHAVRLTVEGDESADIGRIHGRAGLEHAANRAAAIMSPVLAGWIALTGG